MSMSMMPILLHTARFPIRILYGVFHSEVESQTTHYCYLAHSVNTLVTTSSFFHHHHHHDHDHQH